LTGWRKGHHKASWSFSSPSSYKYKYKYVLCLCRLCATDAIVFSRCLCHCPDVPCQHGLIRKV